MSDLPGLATDRLKRAIAAFVRELFPNYDFLGFYTYSVVEWNDGAQTAMLNPAPSVSGLPSIGPVPIRLPGMRVKLKVGQEVLVGFDNGSQTRPYIAHLGTLASGFTPDTLSMDATTRIKVGDGATLGAARLSDPVECGSLTFIPGTGGASLSYNGSPVSAAPVTIAGTVTGASAKVNIE